MKEAAPHTITTRVRHGSHRLWATATVAGADIVVAVGGGDRPHVGCVVLAQPHPDPKVSGRIRVTSSVLSIPPHREEPLARPLAEMLARELGAVVTVSAGVHTDNLTRDEIDVFLRLGERLGARLLARLRHSSGATTSPSR